MEEWKSRVPMERVGGQEGAGGGRGGLPARHGRETQDRERE